MNSKTVYNPPVEVNRKAYIKTMNQYKDMYKKSIDNPEKFWADIASQFHWETPFNINNFCSYNFDLEKGPISIKWMEGATTNLCYNLLDKNVRNGLGDKIAFYW